MAPAPDDQTPPIRLALIEPDMPGNVGTLIRLSACLGVPLDVVEPCGFPWGEARMRRAGLDYLPRAALTRHRSFQAFSDRVAGRLIFAETDAETPYTAFAFAPGDVLMLGSEGPGVPPHARAAAAAGVRVPLRPGLRSLNVAVAAAMILGEALRQTGGFPTC
ncbi:MAG: TrmH family RNA methyltransferase [Sphingomonadaceae bacterium]|nr:TrmH family RNA methyltransferase [Sphingomonadaceae bacterium]